MKNLTDTTAAAKLRAAIDQAAMTWADEQDRAQLEHIAEEIEQGRLAAAHAYACQRDTIIREEIPGDVWVYIGGRLVGE